MRSLRVLVVVLLTVGGMGTDGLSEVVACTTPPKPVIVRDMFCNSVYHAYIPTDKEGRYWWRQSFCSITARDSRDDYLEHTFPMGDALYGEIRPGKWQGPSRLNAENALSNGDADNWLQRRNTAGGIGSYIEWIVPDGHNQINVMFRGGIGTYGKWLVSLVLCHN